MRYWIIFAVVWLAFTGARLWDQGFTWGGLWSAVLSTLFVTALGVAFFLGLSRLTRGKDEGDQE